MDKYCLLLIILPLNPIYTQVITSVLSTQNSPFVWKISCTIHQVCCLITFWQLFQRYIFKGLTWRNSWLEKIDSSDESHFADLYKVYGLKGVYIASQVERGVMEEKINPSNIVTKITFDAGAEWSTVIGPSNDTNGFPIPGCHEVNDIGKYNGCNYFKLF